jgi:hypothetical protein
VIVEWKHIRLGFIPAVLLLPLVGVGCSGINHSQGVSPATFLLPGLIQIDPAPAARVPLPSIDPSMDPDPVLIAVNSK